MTRHPALSLELDDFSNEDVDLSELDDLPADEDGLVPPMISEDPEHDRLVNPEY